MRRDLSISLIRVIAMVFIVLCHVASYFNQTAIASFFDVGVPIFYLISGFLYGDKSIINTTEFLYKRYLRLVIPSIIWLTIVCISAILGCCKFPETHEMIFVLLNLQGLRFIFPSMKELFIGPWFFTTIMMCYVLLVLYRKIERKHPGVVNIFNYGGIVPLLIFCLFAILKVSIFGALSFFAGVVLKQRKQFDNLKKKHIALCLCYFCGAIAIRLYSRRFIDGTVLCNDIIAPITHIVLAGTIVCSFKWIFMVMPKAMKRISSSMIIQHIDQISIYVFISHTFFIDGTVLSIFKLPLSVFILFPVYIMIVLISSTILWLIGNKMTEGVEKCVSWMIS